MSKTITDIEIEKEIDFEDLEFEVLNIDKTMVINKQLNFVFTQSVNWDKF